MHEIGLASSIEDLFYKQTFGMEINKTSSVHWRFRAVTRKLSSEVSCEVAFATCDPKIVTIRTLMRPGSNLLLPHPSKDLCF